MTGLPLIKKSFFLLLIALLLVTSFGAQAVRADEPSDLPHPRLYFTSEDIPELRALRDTESHKDIWNNIKSWADTHIGDVCPAEPSSYGDYWHRADEIRIYIETMGFMYAVTEETKYAEAVKAWMFYVVNNWTKWDLYEGYGHAQANMLRGFAFGYDVLHDYFTSSERDALIAKISYNANQIYEQWYGADYAANAYPNSLLFAACPLGLAGLALYDEHADAPKWLTLAISMSQATLNFGGVDGGWFEGEHYATASFDLLIPFLDALERNTGQNLFDNDFLRQAPYYLIYLVPGNPLPLEDTNWDEGFFKDAGHFMYRLASEYNNSYAQWFANHYSSQDMMQAFIWKAPNLAATPPTDLPLTKQFRDIGYVIWRIGWEANDLLFAFKSGSSQGHAHPSQNEFLILYKNELLTCGAGFVCMEPEDDTWSHNCLLVNGNGQCQEPGDYRSCPLGTRGEILELDAHDPYYRYVLGDASAVYTGWSGTSEGRSYTVGELDKWLRHVVFMEPNYFVIYDEVAASEAKRFDWLLHGYRYSGSSLSVEGETITLFKNGVTLKVKVLAPEGFVTEKTNYDNCDHLKVRPPVSTTQTQFLTVHYPLTTGESMLPTEKVDVGNVIGAKVIDSDKVDLILFSKNGNPVDEYIELGGIYEAIDGGDYLFEGTEVRVQFDSYQVLRLQESGDVTPPVLTSIATSDITESSATISWTTDEPATSQVDYGTSEDLGLSTDLDTTPVTNHSVSLTDLDSATTYHYKVKSEDGADNLATSEVYNFITGGAPSDTTPPVITAVAASDITGFSATITWTTDEPATSQVEYGASEDLELSTDLDTSLVTNHSVILTDLVSATTYHYKVKSDDGSGNLAASEVYNFTTLSPYLSISFTPPTDANNSVVNRDWTEINTSIDSTFGVSSFIDWNKSLVGYWNFNENSGSTAYDKSTYGNNGGLIGGSQWEAGKFGNALKLLSDSDYLLIADSESMDFDKSEGAIALWLYPFDKACGAYQRLVIDSSWDFGNSPGGIELAIQPSGNLYFYPAKGGSNNYNLVIDPLNNNEWQHLTVTWDYSTKKVLIYINGVSKSFAEENVPANWDAIAQTGNWHIGGTNLDVAGKYFNGLIDEVRIYNRALSPEEIEASYNTNLHSLSHKFMDLADGTYEYYAYATDLSGNSAETETRTLVIDTVLPAISNISSSDVTQSSATISWSTDEPATSQVEYGTTEDLGLSTDLDTTPVTNHSVILTDLTSSTTYHYKVKSKDAAGNLATSSNHVFTTEAAASAPVADFSATPTSGDKPLNVQFTDESVGEITDWFWEFGDGGNSADENSSHSYTGAGSYSVSLTVTGPGGSNTETKVDYITVTDTAPLGDANGDGVINALDITKVKRIILELDAETPGADVNQDGKINALDITALEKLIMEQTPQ